MNDTDNIIETFSELSPRYEEVVNAELNRFWGWSYTGFIHQLIEFTPIPEKGRMLDLATGTGVIPLKVATDRQLESSQGSTHADSTALPGRIHGLDITLSMLARARQKMVASKLLDQVDLVCASAMDIPYASASFHLVTCALATHHMDVRLLLAETFRVLHEGGTLSIADVGGSDIWKWPVVKFFLRIAAFAYFLFTENIHRAWAEAGAVSNVRSKDEWFDLLLQLGFQNIKIKKLKSKYRWIPEPLVIQATKPNPGG